MSRLSKAIRTITICMLSLSFVFGIWLFADCKKVFAAEVEEETITTQVGEVNSIYHYCDIDDSLEFKSNGNFSIQVKSGPATYNTDHYTCSFMAFQPGNFDLNVYNKNEELVKVYHVIVSEIPILEYTYCSNIDYWTSVKTFGGPAFESPVFEGDELAFRFKEVRRDAFEGVYITEYWLHTTKAGRYKVEFGQGCTVIYNIVEHDFQLTDTINEATCDEEGQVEKECKHCGWEIRETIPPKGHTWETTYTVDKEPTCTEEGIEFVRCSVCGAINKDSVRAIPALGHKWSDKYTVEKKPTKSEEGSESIHCSVCNAIKEDSIRAIPVLDEAIAAVWYENNIDYFLGANGVLKINGSGDIPDYSKTQLPPWHGRRLDIRKIIISDGITRVGNYAFFGCENLKSVTIPARIGADANGLNVGAYAFDGCEALNDVYYPGTINQWKNIWFKPPCFAFFRHPKMTIHCSDGDYFKSGIATTIKYNGNGGKASAKSKKVVSGKTYGKLATATRKGYRFAGWYTDKTEGEKITNTSIVTPSVSVLYAHWTIVNYKVTYKYNGGSKVNEEDNPETYNVNDVVKLATPTRSGYRFAGWYLDKKFKKKVSQIKRGTVGNKTFYAKWSANTYTITFNKNGATKGKMTSQSMKYGKPKALIANKFSLKGYRFTGWSTAPEGPVEYKNKQKVKNLTAMHKDKITLYAIWQINDYKITYKYNGGAKVNEEDNPTTYTVHDEIILAKPERAGYTFVGWYLDKKYKKKVSFIKVGSTGNKVLYAKWKKSSVE